MFHNIVGLAGLMQPHQLSLIGSRLPGRLLGPISIFLHRSLFLVSRKIKGAMEVNQSMLMNGCTTTTSLMRPAPSTELEATTMVKSALP